MVEKHPEDQRRAGQPEGESQLLERADLCSWERGHSVQGQEWSSLVCSSGVGTVGRCSSGKKTSSRLWSQMLPVRSEEPCFSVCKHSCEQQAGGERKGKAPTAAAGTPPRGEAVLELTGAMSCGLQSLLSEGACTAEEDGHT